MKTIKKLFFVHSFLLCVVTFTSVELPPVVFLESSDRASGSSGRGEAVPEVVIETLVRGRGSARAKGHVRRVAPVRGRAHGATPARGRTREVSPEPQVEVVEDQIPPEF